MENLSTPKNLHEIKDTQSEKRGKIGKWRKVWQGQRGSKMTQAVSMSDPSGKKVNLENHKFEKLNIRCMKWVCFAKAELFQNSVFGQIDFSRISSPRPIKKSSNPILFHKTLCNNTKYAVANISSS